MVEFYSLKALRNPEYIAKSFPRFRALSLITTAEYLPFMKTWSLLRTELKQTLLLLFDTTLRSVYHVVLHD